MDKREKTQSKEKNKHTIKMRKARQNIPYITMIMVEYSKPFATKSKQNHKAQHPWSHLDYQKALQTFNA